MSAELLLPERSIPPTAEHNATLHRTEPSRGKEKPVRLTGAWKSGMGLGGSEYAPCGFVFLDSISCNLVFICVVDGIFGQRPSCVLRWPFHFNTFPLPVRSSSQARLAVGSPAPAQHHKRPPNCRNFLLDVEKCFHPRGRQIITRLHGVTAQYAKFPTPCLFHRRLT